MRSWSNEEFITRESPRNKFTRISFSFALRFRRLIVRFKSTVFQILIFFFLSICWVSGTNTLCKFLVLFFVHVARSTTIHSAWPDVWIAIAKQYWSNRENNLSENLSVCKHLCVCVFEAKEKKEFVDLSIPTRTGPTGWWKICCNMATQVVTTFIEVKSKMAADFSFLRKEFHELFPIRTLISTNKNALKSTTDG